MPNRIIRESSRFSRSLARLSSDAERVWWRMNTVFDDFGRYYGDIEPMLAAAFPVGGIGLSTEGFKRSLEELAAVDCIRFYEVDGRRYVYVPAWDKHQSQRAKVSKFPDPVRSSAIICDHLRADAPVIEDVVVDVIGGGVVVGPEPARPQGQLYVVSCDPCRAMLRMLNELTASFFNAPGRTGEWMHQAHQGRRLEAVLDAIARQVGKLNLDPKRRGWLAPSVLFKPENWDTTINNRDPKKRTLADLLGEEPK